MYEHLCLAGYTVSSVIVGDWRRLYIAGAPRFKHKGKVILFELSAEGDVDISQALNGEQVCVLTHTATVCVCLLSLCMCVCECANCSLRLSSHCHCQLSLIEKILVY